MSSPQSVRTVTSLVNPGRNSEPQETVVSHFERTAARAPDAIAVTEAGRSIDYRGLDAESAALADWLLREGAQPGDRLALCLGKTIERIVGMLGILRAGCAYVPIDGRYPPQRIRQMLTDAAVTIALTDAASAGPLHEAGGTALRCLDVTDRPLRGPADFPAPALTGEDCAYVMFTSGSTGRPKGVMVPHRALLRFTVDCDFMVFDEHSVVLHTTSVAFDPSAMEIWGALLGGGRC